MDEDPLPWCWSERVEQLEARPAPARGSAAASVAVSLGVAPLAVPRTGTSPHTAVADPKVVNEHPELLDASSEQTQGEVLTSEGRTAPYEPSDRSSDVHVARAERRGQRAMCAPDSDEDRARRIDLVRSRERQGQAGQRRSTPADRRSRGVWAQRALHATGHLGREVRDGGRDGVYGAAWHPVEDQVGRLSVALLYRFLPARLRQGGGCDEHADSGRSRRAPSREGHLLHTGPSLVGQGWLELAERAHLGSGRQHTVPAPSESSKLLRGRERAETVEQPFYEVDLRLRERDLEPDATDREPVAASGFDHMISG